MGYGRSAPVETQSLARARQSAFHGKCCPLDSVLLTGLATPAPVGATVVPGVFTQCFITAALYPLSFTLSCNYSDIHRNELCHDSQSVLFHIVCGAIMYCISNF